MNTTAIFKTYHGELTVDAEFDPGGDLGFHRDNGDGSSFWLGREHVEALHARLGKALLASAPVPVTTPNPEAQTLARVVKALAYRYGSVLARIRGQAPRLLELDPQLGALAQAMAEYDVKLAERVEALAGSPDDAE